MLIRVAWRNLWRNRNRSLSIMAAIVLGVWASVFLDAFYAGMIRQRIRNAIETETSHVQVHLRGFLEDKRVEATIPGGAGALLSIQKDPRVEAVSGRIVVEGMLASPVGAYGALALAVDPLEERMLTGIDKRIVEGRYFRDQGRQEMIMGTKFLRKLGLRVGAKVVLSFPDANGDITASAFRIVGRYETVNKPLEETVVYFGRAGVDTLAGIPGAFHEIAVRLKRDDQLDRFTVALGGMAPGAEVRTWKELSPEMYLMASMYDTMMMIYLGIILFALSFGIVNTMLMAVLERRRELGMLIALGMNRWRVFGMVVLETVFLTLAGCPAGVLLAFSSIWLGASRGIRMSMFSKVYESFGFSDVVRPVLVPMHAVVLLALVVVMAIMSGVVPAGMALRIRPAEAIRK